MTTGYVWCNCPMFSSCMPISLLIVFVSLPAFHASLAWFAPWLLCYVMDDGSNDFEKQQPMIWCGPTLWYFRTSTIIAVSIQKCIWTTTGRQSAAQKHCHATRHPISHERNAFILTWMPRDTNLDSVYFARNQKQTMDGNHTACYEVSTPQQTYWKQNLYSSPAWPHDCW